VTAAGALLLALLAPLTPRQADPGTARESAWLGGQVYEENDSLLAGDDRYTQGLRFTLVRRNPPGWLRAANEWLVQKVYSDELDFQPRLSVVFGQNMYTPHIITAPEPYAGDRGFAGVLYGGMQLQFSEVGQRERHTLEGYVGLTGTPSLAEQAQSGLHVLRFSRIPKGWKQAKESVAANLYYRYERRLAACTERRCYADVTLGGLVAVGNMQTAAGLHAAARVGWALTGFPVAAIPNAVAPATRADLEIGAIVGWEGRAVAYNGLLVPSPPTRDFSRKPLVGDFRFGGYARVKDVRLTVLGVERSPEFEVLGIEPRSQSFSSVSLSYEPMTGGHGGHPHWLVRDWRLELGLGGTAMGAGIYGDRHGGPAGRIGVAKGLGRGFFAGLEIDGAATTDQPMAYREDTHNDTFFMLRTLAAGWERAVGRGRIGLRVGPTILKQVLKVQTVDNHLDNDRPVEELSGSYVTGGRWGWIAGLEGWHPLESHTYFGINLTYAHPKWDRPLSKSDFVTFLLGIQIRP
jgi:hypothetical protein